MAKVEYDPECAHLARYFLQYPGDETLVIELAGVIQEAIEDWEKNRPKGRTLAEVFKEEERIDATDNRTTTTDPGAGIDPER